MVGGSAEGFMRKHESQTTLFLIALTTWSFGCGPPSDPVNKALEPELIIDGGPACAECEIRLQTVALLGGPRDPASVAPDAAGRNCALARLSTGEFVLGAVVGGGELFVFQSDGTMTGRIGRRGQGPGELSGTLALAVGAGDTLFVLDNDQARLSVFSSAGTFIRSFSAPNRVPAFALLTDGRFLFHRTPLGPTEALFYLTDSDGKGGQQFGEVTQEVPELDGQVIAPGDPEGFWTASIWAYELFLHKSPVSAAKRVIRRVDWFPPGGKYVDGMPFSIPSPPVLKHLWDNGDGQVWVYSLVPDRSWEPNIPLSPLHEWGRLSFDTIIEVLDMGTGEVVASGRYDEMLGTVCGSPLAYAVVDSEEGDTKIQVFQPTVVQGM